MKLCLEHSQMDDKGKERSKLTMQSSVRLGFRLTWEEIRLCQHLQLLRTDRDQGFKNEVQLSPEVKN